LTNGGDKPKVFSWAGDNLIERNTNGVIAMLKFEHIQPGTRIKAYDFEPIPGRPERYVTGTVVKHDEHQGAGVLVIECDGDFAFPEEHNRVGLEVLVPMELVFEYDFTDRVQVLEVA
jgi:hypothetical protein